MTMPPTEINERTPGYHELEEIKVFCGHIRFKEWPDQCGRFMEYREIWVDEEWRRKGWGRKLMKMLVKETKRREMTEIYVRANTDGESDILGKFITAVGFKPTYEIEKQYEDLSGGTGERRMSFLGNRLIWRDPVEISRNERYGFNFKKKV